MIVEQIIALAEEHGLVIESNAHLSAALSGFELDESIPIELSEVVAEVIAFVLQASGPIN